MIDLIGQARLCLWLSRLASVWFVYIQWCSHHHPLHQSKWASMSVQAQSQETSASQALRRAVLTAAELEKLDDSTPTYSAAGKAYTLLHSLTVTYSPLLALVCFWQPCTVYSFCNSQTIVSGPGARMFEVLTLIKAVVQIFPDVQATDNEWSWSAS